MPTSEELSERVRADWAAPTRFKKDNVERITRQKKLIVETDRRTYFGALLRAGEALVSGKDVETLLGALARDIKDVQFTGDGKEEHRQIVDDFFICPNVQQPGFARTKRSDQFLLRVRGLHAELTH